VWNWRLITYSHTCICVWNWRLIIYSHTCICVWNWKLITYSHTCICVWNWRLIIYSHTCIRVELEADYIQPHVYMCVELEADVYGATCVYVSNILALLSTAHNHFLCTRLLHRLTTSYPTSCHPCTTRDNPITCIVHHRFIQITSQSQYPVHTLRDPTTKEIIIAHPPQNNPHQYYCQATLLNLTYIQFATQLHHQTSTLDRSRAPEGTPDSIRRCDHDSSNECYGLRLFRSLFGHVMTLRQLMRVLLLALL
jgi:hypothetical protein